MVLQRAYKLLLQLRRWNVLTAAAMIAVFSLASPGLTAAAKPSPLDAAVETVDVQDSGAGVGDGTAEGAVSVAEPGGIKPVSPAEFVARINEFIADINTAISGLVLPVATTVMLVSIVVITAGFLVGHSNLKRYGWGGLFLACCGVFLFYGLPLIIGLVRTLAYRLGGG
ncbi:hypothetical protein V3F56_03090 [Moorellaceae bacterium AZ2]